MIVDALGDLPVQEGDGYRLNVDPQVLRHEDRVNINHLCDQLIEKLLNNPGRRHL
jgi:hypothetical protein